MATATVLQNGLSIDRSISEAAASLKMEGFQVDPEAKEMCHQVLMNELTLEEYIRFALHRAGVTAP